MKQEIYALIETRTRSGKKYLELSIIDSLDDVTHIEDEMIDGANRRRVVCVFRGAIDHYDLVAREVVRPSSSVGIGAVLKWEGKLLA